MKARAELVFYTDNDLKNFTFFKFPKSLLTEYRDMSDSAKILYMLFYDRLFLSQDNAKRFSDDNGILYIIYPLHEIIANTGWSRDKAKRALNCLEEYNLIYRSRESSGMAYRLYVSKIIVDNSEQILGVGSK